MPLVVVVVAEGELALKDPVLLKNELLLAQLARPPNVLDIGTPGPLYFDYLPDDVSAFRAPLALLVFSLLLGSAPRLIDALSHLAALRGVYGHGIGHAHRHICGALPGVGFSRALRAANAWLLTRCSHLRGCTLNLSVINNKN